MSGQLRRGLPARPCCQSWFCWWCGVSCRPAAVAYAGALRGSVRRCAMSRVVIAAILISLHCMWGAPVALAAEWCDTDPLVAITTPGGNVVPVYVMVGALGAEHLPAAQVASILYTTASDKATAGGAPTKVGPTGLVPEAPFPPG